MKKYPASFIKKVKVACPDCIDFHTALERGDDDLIHRHFLDLCSFSIDFGRVIDLFAQGRERDILTEAEVAKERLLLRIEWDKLCFERKNV